MVTGQKTRGFRGPGYSLSKDVLEVLADREYRYDASTFPTFLGPLGRSYYFFKADLSDEEKAERKQLFGTFRDGLQPLRPYRWGVGDNTVCEIPVTTLPLLKTPFHFSYQLYVATYSRVLANIYFRAALATCRALRVQPSLLLHPLDFLGGAEVPELSFFPSMNLDTSLKLDNLTGFLRSLARTASIVGMDEYAATCSNRDLQIRQPPTVVRSNKSRVSSG
jgi:hypothetical protein